ncbi:MAG: tetratricopeptide repeat protein [Myxococcota bacterium]|nr:tetratricopeptide repeat protein [Myxococcota bacterium]
MKRNNAGIGCVFVPHFRRARAALYGFLVVFSMMGISGPSWAQAPDKPMPSQDPASSSTPEESEMMTSVNEAIQLFKANRYEDAIAKFEQAYLIMPDPNILFNIARCYDLLGNKTAAIDYYTRFIERGDVPEAAKGRARASLKKLVQQPKESEVKPDPPPKQKDEAVEPSSEGSSESVDLTASVEHPRTSRVPEWLLVSLGGAALVTGGIFSGLALDTHKDFETNGVFEEKEDLEAKGKQQALVGDIFLGVGTASVVTGVLLFIFRGGETASPPESVSMQYKPLVSPKGGGVAATVYF